MKVPRLPYCRIHAQMKLGLKIPTKAAKRAAREAKKQPALASDEPALLCFDRRQVLALAEAMSDKQLINVGVRKDADTGRWIVFAHPTVEGPPAVQKPKPTEHEQRQIDVNRALQSMGIR